MIKGPKKTVGLILPMALYDKLSELAQKSCRTVPSYIRQICKRHVQEIEQENGAPGSSRPTQTDDPS